jgi:Peptidase family M28
MTPPLRSLRLPRAAQTAVAFTWVFLAQAVKPSAAAAQQSSPDTATPAHVRAILSALADDSMEGRGTGTPGSMRAARFIAEQMRAAGLVPAGDSGYFQHVPMVHRMFDTASTIAVDGTTLHALRDFVASPSRGAPPAVLDGVTAIYGGVAGDTTNPLTPDQVKGRLVILSAPPAPAHGRGRGRRPGRSDALAQAAGIATIAGPDLPAALLRGATARPGAILVVDPSAPRATSGAQTLTITEHAAELLLGAPLAGATKGLVGRTARGGGRFVDTPALGGNVVGIIPGIDPALRDDVVLVDAHYDHLGVRTPAVPGADSIYNGADDDGSGSTAVLEIARVIRAGPAPKRTLVFVTTTGEEVGLLGTNWYIAHPVRPLTALVANLEIEMIGRPDSLAGGPGRAWLTGFERSTMGQMFARAGLPIVPDRRPEQQFFQRSDNIAFARMGIPAHTLSTFNLHGDYHQASDEVSKVDFVHMTGVINAAVRAVELLANGPAPHWNPNGRP